MTTKSEAVESAIREGMAIFAASTHIGPVFEWAGFSWEDSGFAVDDDGKPTCSPQGNALSWVERQDIDPTNPRHVYLCEKWFHGE